MKRFHCTGCHRQVRVRKLPSGAVAGGSGKCRYCAAGKERKPNLAMIPRRILEGKEMGELTDFRVTTEVPE